MGRKNIGNCRSNSGNTRSRSPNQKWHSKELPTWWQFSDEPSVTGSNVLWRTSGGQRKSKHQIEINQNKIGDLFGAIATLPHKHRKGSNGAKRRTQTSHGSKKPGENQHRNKPAEKYLQHLADEEMGASIVRKVDADSHAPV